MEVKYKDYFSFESIRDKAGEIVCYHITMIGTVEEAVRVNDEETIAFGKLVLHNLDRRIGTLLELTGSRTYFHDNTYLEGIVNVIRFAAHKHHIQEVREFTEGDRVLVEGRAYIRDARDPSVRPELTVSVTGTFLLGRKRNLYRKQNLVPQEGIE